jgi:hypothetical protein
MKAKETITRSGSLLTRAYHTVGATHLGWALMGLLVDLAAGMRCVVRAAVMEAAGLPGRTPGGRCIEDMRAVASSADQVAL